MGSFQPGNRLLRVALRSRDGFIRIGCDTTTNEFTSMNGSRSPNSVGDLNIFSGIANDVCCIKNYLVHTHYISAIDWLEKLTCITNAQHINTRIENRILQSLALNECLRCCVSVTVAV